MQVIYFFLDYIIKLIHKNVPACAYLDYRDSRVASKKERTYVACLRDGIAYNDCE